MKLKVVLAAVAAIGLSGCATTQPEPMPEKLYRDYSGYAVQLKECYKDGYITEARFAEGVQNLAFFVGTWKHDKEHLNYYYEYFSGRVKANPTDCRKVDSNISESGAARERIVKGQQEAADRQYQQWVDAAEALNQNKTTWCNKVGNTVMCR